MARMDDYPRAGTDLDGKVITIGLPEDVCRKHIDGSDPVMAITLEDGRRVILVFGKTGDDVDRATLELGRRGLP